MSDALAVSAPVALRMLANAGAPDPGAILASLKPAARFDGFPYYDGRAVSRAWRVKR
jgi:hypothetical protein